jgi:hypothetical protein
MVQRAVTKFVDKLRSNPVGRPSQYDLGLAGLIGRSSRTCCLIIQYRSLFLGQMMPKSTCWQEPHHARSPASLIKRSFGGSLCDNTVRTLTSDHQQAIKPLPELVLVVRYSLMVIIHAIQESPHPSLTHPPNLFVLLERARLALTRLGSVRPSSAVTPPPTP